MIITRPVATEKAMRLMESENTLVFIVDRKARKPEIREAIEKTFDVKVARVNSAIDRQGHKRAFVKLASESPAIDLATKLGMM